MSPQRLEQLRRRLAVRAPLVGPALRRRAAERLWRRGGPAAVRHLARAAAETADAGLRRFILSRLAALTDADGIDEVVRAWSDTRDAELGRMIESNGWSASPSEPTELRVRSALKAGRLEPLTGGEPESVGPLLEALDDADPVVAHNALAVIRRLSLPAAREAVCEAFVESGNEKAGKIALATDFAPADPRRRAVFYFLAGQWEQYAALDFDGSILRTAYDVAGADVRCRLAAVARRAGRVEFAAAAAGGRLGVRLAEMTDTEWETVLAVLAPARRGADLWRLAQSAPPVWAARILRRLTEAGWSPGSDAEGSGSSADEADFMELAELSASWQPPQANADGLGNPGGPGWDALRVEPVVLRGHAQPVLAIAFTPGGSLLATGGRDRTLRIWSLSSGIRTDTSADGGSLVRQAGQVVRCLAVSPDGKTLASGGMDGKILLWGLPDGRQLSRLPGHVGWVSQLTCLRETSGNEGAPIRPEPMLLSAGSDGRLRLWALPGGREVATLRGGPEAAESAWSLAVAPDGCHFASGHNDGRLDLWGDGGFVATAGRQGGAVNAVTFCAGGRVVAGGAADGTVRFARSPGGEGVALRHGHEGSVHCLAVGAEGAVLASGGHDGTVQLWRAATGERLCTLRGHNKPVSRLAASGDGRLLASAGGDGAVRLWGLPGGELLHVLQGHEGWVNALAFNDRRGLLASAGDDGLVRVWSAGTLRLSRMPVARMTLDDLQRARDALVAGGLTPLERGVLELAAALIARRHRYDVLVEDAPQRRVSAGEFDIEIG